MSSFIPDVEPSDGDIHGDDPRIEVMSPRRGLLGAAETRLKGFVGDGKAELVRSIGGLVVIAQELAAQVESVGGGPFAGYARQAVGLIDDIKTRLDEKPIDELLDDGRALIREQPAVAVAAAMALGFLAARVIKASSR